MALLSIVTVVEKPSLQPDTPQPMTGPALEVFAVGPFPDPPENGAGGFLMLMQYDNPIPGMSTILNPSASEEHDISDPQHIHGLHLRVVDWDWNGVRPDFANSQSFNAFQPANNTPVVNVGVYRGGNRPETISIDGTDLTRINQITETLNGKAGPVATLLDKDSPTGAFSTAAYDILSTYARSEPPTVMEERPIHAWVMCGEAYIMSNIGRVYKSTDGFSNNITERGTAVLNAVRMNPGIVENDPIGL